MIADALRAVPSLVATVALCATAIGCECDAEAASEPAPTPAAPRPALAALGPVSDAAAFAITATSDGALVAWGDRERGGVIARRVDPLGAAHGEPIHISDRDESRAREVELAAQGAEVGVAWIASSDEGLRAMAAFSLDGGARFSAPSPLERSAGDASRGRLALTAHADALVLYQRLEEADCIASEGRCARFTRRGIGPHANDVERGTEPLEVEEPCEPFVAGAAYADGTHYHAVCHVEEGTPRTTVYAIRPAIAYAVPQRWDDCTPVALTALRGAGVALVMRCDGELALSTLDEMGRVTRTLRPLVRQLGCRDGRPTLALRGADDSLALELGEAQDHLEALLPEALAPAGSRAVWTGEAILVARATDGSLALARHVCSEADDVDSDG
ncbi:MAG: hypothetical protein AB7S26_06395 [Sandaracinaceae bacterium]